MSVPFSQIEFQRLLEDNQQLILQILDCQRQSDYQRALTLHNQIHKNLTRLAASADFALVASQSSSFWPPGLPMSSYWPNSADLPPKPPNSQ
ncbi:hypothetical protein GEMRC1_004384 [Eukaryota sp. GEM-RC1]